MASLIYLNLPSSFHIRLAYRVSSSSSSSLLLSLSTSLYILLLLSFSLGDINHRWLSPKQIKYLNEIKRRKYEHEHQHHHRHPISVIRYFRKMIGACTYYLNGLLMRIGIYYRHYHSRDYHYHHYHRTYASFASTCCLRIDTSINRMSLYELPGMIIIIIIYTIIIIIIIIIILRALYMHSHRSTSIWLFKVIPLPPQ